MEKKIRIFLGAYVNFPNAQNINCDNIAKYLDKDKFEVHTMYTPKMSINKRKYEKNEIHLHRLFHRRIVWEWSKYLTMLLGRYDIYYLPKMEDVDIQFIKKYKKRAVFLSSIEGVVGEQISGKDIRIREKYFLMDDIFSISDCIRKSALECWNRETKTLYLGIDIPERVPKKSRQEVRNIVWIGSIIERKRPTYFIECAKRFPKLNFTMIGDGELLEELKDEFPKNLRFLGRIPNMEVYKVLQDMDLLLMTSDKEGLPKVIGEAMSMRVPAIYINECYEVDYIHDGENGYAVANLSEMIEKIQYLLDKPVKFQKMSEKAYKSIQKYTWGNLIKKYENYFILQYEKHRKNWRGRHDDLQ